MRNLTTVIARILLMWIHGSSTTGGFFDTPTPPEQLELPGEAVLGGLFPVHGPMNKDATDCLALRKGRGVHRVMAMIFAIESINNSTSLLPSVKLGARIFDSCSNDNYGLNMSMNFVDTIITEHDISSLSCVNGQLPKYHTPPKPLVGVIGGSYSGVSTIVAQLLRIYKIAQVSPASTAADLSDKFRYGFFARTVPSDFYQGMVLAHILRRFNWTYVSLIYSESDYGRKGADDFKSEAKLNQLICIVYEGKFNGKPHDAIEIIKQIKAKAEFDQKNKGAKAVVLFTSNDDTKELLRAAQKEDVGGIQWIASEGWETLSMDIVQDREKYAQGALVIAVKSGRVRAFEEYFRTNVHRFLTKSTWIREFWEAEFNCSFSPTFHERLCTGREVMSDKIISGIDDKVEFVIAAVYAMAHALHQLVEDKCGDTVAANGVLCAEVLSSGGSSLRNGTEFYRNYLMRVNFTCEFAFFKCSVVCRRNVARRIRRSVY